MQFHLIVNNILTESARFLAKKANEVSQIRRKAAFSHFFGTPQPPDSAEDFPKEYPRNSDFCHSKYHAKRMSNHPRSYFVELVPERWRET